MKIKILIIFSVLLINTPFSLVSSFDNQRKSVETWNLMAGNSNGAKVFIELVRINKKKEKLNLANLTIINGNKNYSVGCNYPATNKFKVSNNKIEFHKNIWISQDSGLIRIHFFREKNNHRYYANIQLSSNTEYNIHNPVFGIYELISNSNVLNGVAAIDNDTFNIAGSSFFDRIFISGNRKIKLDVAFRTAGKSVFSLATGKKGSKKTNFGFLLKNNHVFKISSFDSKKMNIKFENGYSINKKSTVETIQWKPTDEIVGGGLVGIFVPIPKYTRGSITLSKEKRLLSILEIN